MPRTRKETSCSSKLEPSNSQPFSDALAQLEAGSVDQHAAFSRSVLSHDDARALGFGLVHIQQVRRNQQRANPVRRTLPSALLPPLF